MMVLLARYYALTQHVEIFMLNYVVTFFLLAVLAAFLGFGGLAGAFASIAQFLAVVFVVLFLVSLIKHTANGKTPIP